jgi:hypothetical protein
MIQFIHTKEKYLQYLYHDIYSSYLCPYGFSALFFRLEAQQILNGTIWSNIKFGYKTYFTRNEPDNLLFKWRC